MEEKKCAKCGKDLCDDCTCAHDDTLCKDCGGEGDSVGEEEDGCTNCVGGGSCCGSDKEEEKNE